MDAQARLVSPPHCNARPAPAGLATLEPPSTCGRQAVPPEWPGDWPQTALLGEAAALRPAEGRGRRPTVPPLLSRHQPWPPAAAPAAAAAVPACRRLRRALRRRLGDVVCTLSATHPPFLPARLTLFALHHFSALQLDALREAEQKSLRHKEVLEALQDTNELLSRALKRQREFRPYLILWNLALNAGIVKIKASCAGGGWLAAVRCCPAARHPCLPGSAWRPAGLAAPGAFTLLPHLVGGQAHSSHPFPCHPCQALVLKDPGSPLAHLHVQLACSLLEHTDAFLMFQVRPQCNF